MSKAFDLISRFSEDIDITVFRTDIIDEPTAVDDLERMSRSKRKKHLKKIRKECSNYITGKLREFLAEQLADSTGGIGKINIYKTDNNENNPTLLVKYPEIEPSDKNYIQSVVRIEAGAKSALDPHHQVIIRPYIADDATNLDLAISGVTTIEASRTFWDKVMIAHGHRSHSINGQLKHNGERMSRHYYDLHCIFCSGIGKQALMNRDLGADCVRHTQMFFNGDDYDFSSANPGTFSITPNEAMVKVLSEDYTKMRGMIFGDVPSFEEVLVSVNRIERILNNEYGDKR